MPKNIISATVWIIGVIALTFILIKFCTGNNRQYTKTDIEVAQAATKAAYQDSLEFVRGQLDLKSNAVEEQTVKVADLEKRIDSLTKRHQVTKTKVKVYEQDTGFVLAPQEYIDECEECFHTLTAYKKENIQLRFERDGYDTLMRLQTGIAERRAEELEGEKLIFNKMYNDCMSARAPEKGVTRKLKISAMGQLNDLFIPNGGGPGLIYEDKKFNEFGAHVVFTPQGKMYMLHIAKTISLRRKK